MKWRRRRELRCKIFSIHRSLSRHSAIRPSTPSPEYPRLSGKTIWEKAMAKAMAMAKSNVERMYTGMSDVVVVVAHINVFEISSCHVTLPRRLIKYLSDSAWCLS